jgi:cytochrome c551/c552
MKKIFVIFLCAGFLLSAGLFAADGKDLFVRKGCNKCHSLDKYEIVRLKPGEDQGPDLSDVATKHDAEWMTKWLKKKVKKKNKDGEMAKHSNTWKGSSNQLKALVEFLSGLKG